jgi:hypothetical protein
MNWVAKLRNAAAHAAIGVITIWAGEETKNTPWERLLQFFSQPFMRWLDSQAARTTTFLKLAPPRL